MGKQVLKKGKAPGSRRGNRLRIRSVLQNLMYMGALFLNWAKHKILRLYYKNRWSEAMMHI